MVSSSFRRRCFRPLLSFSRFHALVHAAANVTRLLVVANLDTTLVLVVVVKVTLVIVAVVVTLVLVVVVVVAVVNVILLADDKVLFLFFSSFFGFRAPFLRSVAYSMTAMLAIMGCFLLPCVAECMEETSLFSSAIFVTPFPVSITI